LKTDKKRSSFGLMQKTQQRSLKPRALPDRGIHNRQQRPLSSSSASSISTSPPAPPSATASIAKGKGGDNVDKFFFKNFVEMVPLVESLMISYSILFSFTRFSDWLKKISQQ
jgi:hypothetical protein